MSHLLHLVHRQQRVNGDQFELHYSIIVVNDKRHDDIEVILVIEFHPDA